MPNAAKAAVAAASRAAVHVFTDAQTGPRFKDGGPDADLYGRRESDPACRGLLLIGIAVKEGVIRSIDDPAENYGPGLNDSEYGCTPLAILSPRSMHYGRR